MMADANAYPDRWLSISAVKQGFNKENIHD
jgi:hypothetical protein